MGGLAPQAAVPTGGGGCRAAWRRALRPLGGFAAGLLLFYLAASTRHRPAHPRVERGRNQREAWRRWGAGAEGTGAHGLQRRELFGPPLLSFAGPPKCQPHRNRALRDAAFRPFLSDLGSRSGRLNLLWRPAASARRSTWRRARLEYVHRGPGRRRT